MSWSLHLVEDDFAVAWPVDGHTYNLSPMWRLAGLFREGSKDLGGLLAKDLLVGVEGALHRAEAFPDAFRALNPPNGWGDYEGFVETLRRLRDECSAHPDARTVWHG